MNPFAPCSQAVDQDGGHTDVAKVMNTWTKQIGYPVITINTTNGEIYQKHFLFNDTYESKYVLREHLFITLVRTGFVCRFPV